MNGYLKAKENDITLAERQIFYLLESKNALEFENNLIAPLRLFETLLSEKNTSDKLLSTLKLCSEHFAQMPVLNYNSLQPYLIYEINKKYKEDEIQNSIFKKEFNQYLLENTQEDKLLQAFLLMAYMLKFKPLKFNNTFSANYILQAIFTENKLLLLPLLPIAQFLKQENNQIQILLNEAFAKNNLQAWAVFMMDIVSKASIFRLNQLMAIDTLKQLTQEQLLKYTACNFPYMALNTILFSQPIVKVSMLTSNLHCHRQTAYNYLFHLEKMGILIEKKVGREKLFLHKRYLDVLMG